MSSKGALSEIVRGRRVISEKYIDKLPEAFQLDELEGRYLQVLVRMDHARDERLLGQLTKQQRSLRTSLQIDRGRKLKNSLAHDPLAMEVYCAFGLFGSRACRADLDEFFESIDPERLDGALAALLHEELIGQDKNGFFLNTKGIIYSDSEDGISHLNLLRTAMGDAQDKVAHWFHRPTEAQFVSSIVSVKFSEYQKFIKRMRTEIVAMQAELESSSSDSLVRINMQIYPIHVPPAISTSEAKG